MEFIQGLLNDKKIIVIFAFAFVILIVSGVFYINISILRKLHPVNIKRIMI